MKYIVVILDGSSGWAVQEFGNNTSLEQAAIPILDLMVAQGRSGTAKTIPDGLEPSSSAACTSILGFDAAKNYVGRSAIEAAAMGIKLGEGEVSLRVNTVTVQDGIMKSYAAGHITTEESHEIVERVGEMLDDERIAIHPGVAYRHIAVVKDMPGLVDLDYTAPHDITDKPVAGEFPRLRAEGEGEDEAPTTSTRESQEEARTFLEEFHAKAHEILKSDPVSNKRIAEGKMPVTDMWAFWPGVAPKALPQFEESFGVRAALSSGVDLLFGLATLFGLEKLEIEGVSDGPDNDYSAQAIGCLEALKEHDIVFIHIESPDEMGHAGNAEGKVEAIEAIDRLVMSRIFSYVKANPNTRVLAMPDHPTPISIKTHVNEPVPFVMWGAGIEPNGGFAFSEKSAETTGLYYHEGHKLLHDFIEG